MATQNRGRHKAHKKDFARVGLLTANKGIKKSKSNRRLTYKFDKIIFGSYKGKIEIINGKLILNCLIPNIILQSSE